MKFKAIDLGHSRFVVSKSEKKNDIIALKVNLKVLIFAYFSKKTYVVGTY